MKTLENIVTVRGTLAKCFSQLEPETILHSDEISEIRLTNKDYRKQGSWTADFLMYAVESEEPVLYLARIHNNIIFRDIENASEQLIKTKNYNVDANYAKRIMKDKTTLRISLSELRLERRDAELSFMTITPSRFRNLNATERLFAERVYGDSNPETGDQFGSVMDMYVDTPIKEVKIFILNPTYVMKKAIDNPIARVCWSNSIEGNYHFNATISDVGNIFGALRGVAKK